MCIDQFSIVYDFPNVFQEIPRLPSRRQIEFQIDLVPGTYWTSFPFPLYFAKHSRQNTFGDISGKVAADFGCGCGTLGIAGALLGAEQVVGIDIDSQSLEIASLNAADLELDVNLIWCDIKNLKWRGKIVDTVVMNPPFGTGKKGSDMDFLFTALKVASQAVYSLHKTTTRDVSNFLYQLRSMLFYDGNLLIMDTQRGNATHLLSNIKTAVNENFELMITGILQNKQCICTVLFLELQSYVKNPYPHP
ncbi:uncharacterized protein LOC131248201 [Magnolia sinica]|uniref:uncharacterized protein LOC131248201 n=1 Tax=Magnolia sinica TaxID=86752 RepID=UPI00265B0AD3|nr:uncharacterized protein LOC131248201 [Magnolia sinica]